MSFVLNLPPSALAREAKAADSGDDGPKKKSREDYKKMKELEEARKAGTVPAMQDEEGKDINPHIPQYIMQAPWYIGSTVPTLRHQRLHDEKQKQFAKLHQVASKGVRDGPVATKYRKGACENCGALTHQKKDCLERPRKIGAKYTGDSIAPDEHIPENLDFDYEGKRDYWKSFDVETYNPERMEENDKLEEAKRQLKAKKMEEKIEMIAKGETAEVIKADDSDDDELKYADDVDMPGQKFETKQRITVRNLRIREDTAKYLLNLDVNSAYYDPKTRAMRGNPLAGTSKEQTSLYGGENFHRASGDAIDMAKQQQFAWEAYEKGADVHLQADPTKLELLQKEFVQRKEHHEEKKKNVILDKYGGEEHLEAPPKELLLAQTENYVEYSRSGAIIKGQEKAVTRSMYEEDVYFNNHTAVWGSFWYKGGWGYKCCHSLIKESYCTGDKGKLLSNAAPVPASSSCQSSGLPVHEEQEQPTKSLVEQHRENRINKRKKQKDKKKSRKYKKKKSRQTESSSDSSSSSSSESSDSSADEDMKRERKVLEAMRRQDAEDRRAKAIMSMDERKRPFNSFVETHEPTEEEMEAYRRRQKRLEDPMANLL